MGDHASHPGSVSYGFLLRDLGAGRYSAHVLQSLKGHFEDVVSQGS